MAKNCKVCGKKNEIIWEGDGVQYPVYSCESCGIETNHWKKWWEVYSILWKEKSSWNSKKDGLSCLIGYFCNKFYEFYGHPYSFDISNPIPYKGKEFTMARRIIAMFDGNAREAAMYIKWAFAKKVGTRKRMITSLGFFAISQFVNEYNYEKSQSVVLRRQTALPSEYLSWCERELPEILRKHDLKTWNDLNSLVSFVKVYKVDGIEKKAVEEAVNRKMLNIKNDEIEFKVLED